MFSSTNQKIEKAKLAQAVSLFAIWAFLRFFLTAKIRSFFFHHISAHDIKILINHAVIALEAMILFLTYVLIFKTRKLKSITQKNLSIKKVILLGVVVGFIIALLSVPVAFYFGMKVSPQFSVIDTIGNLFSNAAEEIIYRGILFTAVMVACRQKYLAVVISSIAFGIGHWDMPILFQIYVTFIGIILGITYLKSERLIAPYISHTIADFILDSVFH